MKIQITNPDILRAKRKKTTQLNSQIDADTLPELVHLPQLKKLSRSFNELVDITPYLQKGTFVLR